MGNGTTAPIAPPEPPPSSPSSDIRAATVTVDGLVKPGGGPLDPAAIAEIFFALHEQPASSGEAERVVRPA